MIEVHGFELLQDRQIAELKTRVRRWRHIRTGAELLSLENEDENKTFGITFRTPPPDSTGVAHIMEHSVLCGSEKYPVKEPFVELIKGSLNTFLNAFTFPDKTCYPVASANLQDFYNLIDVYLDAVFHPFITPYTLAQEGWHYELDAVDGEMTYKGVVFNEMKGDYSSADSVLSDQSRKALYPDTLYSLDSGGDPEIIPDLTFEEFKSFHQDYYHPTNARIWFYGDDDPDQRLALIDKALAGYEKRPIDSSIRLQKPFTQPVRKEVFYDCGEDENPRAQVCVNWMLPEQSDAETSLGLAILEYILIGTPAAPLRKVLIDSGWGEDLTGNGLDTDFRQPMFSTGLKGIQEDKAAATEKLILDTLQDLADKGIDPDTVSASLNTVEFHLRENNTGSFPRGLSLMLRSLHTWLYDQDPIHTLAFEAPLAGVKSHLEKGEPYFENLIRTYFLQNTHRAVVLLKPDPELGKQRAARERERIAKVRAGMNPAQIDEIVAATQDLKQRQQTPDSPEALATIPMLQRSDLEPLIKKVPGQEIAAGGGKILFHDLFTNGIAYLDLGFDLHSLPPAWLPYLPLFSRALLETGTTSLNFVQLIQKIGQRTGGIHPTTFISGKRGSAGSAAWLILRGKVMAGQTDDLLDILRETIFNARLDNRERIRQMVLEDKASYKSGLTDAGHIMINTRLKAHFNEANWANEQTGGLTQLLFLRRLQQEIDSDWASVQAILEDIRERLFTRGASLVNLTLDEANFAQCRPSIERFIAGLPERSLKAEIWKPAAYPRSEGWTLPSQVNFVGKGANIFEQGYKLQGSAFVILPYLRNTYLWEKVRVMGGAYGGFTTFDHYSGVLNYVSYRDPNVDQTLAAYDGAADFLRNLDLSEDELTRSIIGAIGDIDGYQLPDAKGYSALLRYMTGYSDEERQRIRDQVLATSSADFHAFADVLDIVRQKGDVVVLGTAESIQASAAKQDMQVEKIL